MYKNDLKARRTQKAYRDRCRVNGKCTDCPRPVSGAARCLLCAKVHRERVQRLKMAKKGTWNPRTDRMLELSFKVGA